MRDIISRAVLKAEATNIFKQFSARRRNYAPKRRRSENEPNFVTLRTFSSCMSLFAVYIYVVASYNNIIYAIASAITETMAT